MGRFDLKTIIVLFMLFERDNNSVISRVVIGFVTIVTPHDGRIFRQLSYTTVNRFLIIYLLVLNQDLDLW
jgi:hypothetical protein